MRGRLEDLVSQACLEEDAGGREVRWSDAGAPFECVHVEADEKGRVSEGFLWLGIWA